MEIEQQLGKQAEKPKFSIISLRSHIDGTVKIVNQLTVELEQARGVLKYLRQLESTFKFDGQE